MLMDTNGHTILSEDYVSFEVAKLLKEKGFDSDEVGCHGGFYSEKCYEYGHGIKTQSGQEVGIVYDDLTNSDLEYDEYLRPTHQMAMKWLREVHKLAFIISPQWAEGDMRNPCRWYWEIRGLEDIGLDVYSNPLCNTYEEAVEAACIYSLKNLI